MFDVWSERERFKLQKDRFILQEKPNSDKMIFTAPLVPHPACPVARPRRCAPPSCPVYPRITSGRIIHGHGVRALPVRRDGDIAPYRHYTREGRTPYPLHITRAITSAVRTARAPWCSPVAVGRDVPIAPPRLAAVRGLASRTPRTPSPRAITRGGSPPRCAAEHRAAWQVAHAESFACRGSVRGMVHGRAAHPARWSAAGPPGPRPFARGGSPLPAVAHRPPPPLSFSGIF